MEMSNAESALHLNSDAESESRIHAAHARKSLASTLQVAALSHYSLMAARFFLAAAEAGFGPGIPYLLTLFYKKARTRLQMPPVSLGSPPRVDIRGRPGLRNHLWSSRSSELETAFHYTASFLSRKEKEVARDRAAQQTGTSGAARIGRISLDGVLMALMGVDVLMPPFVCFGYNAFALRYYLERENRRFEAKEDIRRANNTGYEQRRVGVENDGYRFKNFL
ncbi:hypothetical protein DL770_005655 [Monosporascus sp. CRB-9-2]|nr:hypothetical protein DL770_005655 [Monosporascus sp. CRB-9-2]